MEQLIAKAAKTWKLDAWPQPGTAGSNRRWESLVFALQKEILLLAHSLHIKGLCLSGSESF